MSVNINSVSIATSTSFFNFRKIWQCFYFLFELIVKHIFNSNIFLHKHTRLFSKLLTKILNIVPKQGHIYKKPSWKVRIILLYAKNVRKKVCENMDFMLNLRLVNFVLYNLTILVGIRELQPVLLKFYNCNLRS